MFFTLVLVLSFLASPPLVSAQQWSPEIEEAIEDYLATVMECHRVPGLSVAVVSADAVLMARGFGQADMERGVPATEDTRFCIGSCSKAFMATLLGSLLDQHNQTYPAGWNTRLKDVFGSDFQLGDPHITELATIKDTLTHRMGLGQYIGAVYTLVDPSRSRQEYCSRLKHFETVADFRDEFIYNNWMFMLASCVAEVVAGQSFEQLIQERVFDELGMTNTILSEQGFGENVVATSYYINETDGQIGVLDPELIGIYPAEASGGICGPATDMALWTQFALQDSKLPVLSEETWEDTQTPQFINGQGDVAVPIYPVTNDMPNYGLGWEVGTYRGYRKSSHSGSLSGFDSRVTVFHDVDLAIYTGSNGPMYSSDAHNVMHFYISDLVLGLEPWLDNTTACTYPAPWEPEGSHSQSQKPGQRYDTQNAGDGDLSYVADATDPIIGQYGHPFFGNMTVFFDEGSNQLRIETGRFGFGYLLQRAVIEAMYEVHLDGPLEYFSYAGPNYGLYPPLLFQNLVGNSTHGEYQEIFAIGIEPRAPPTYYRGFQWDDEYPPIL